MTICVFVAIMGCTAIGICDSVFAFMLIPLLLVVMFKFDELQDRIWFLEEKLKGDNKDGL